jgi:hypothetical protein
MNKEQFIYWLKGFAKAVNKEGPTPKQWETIVSELDKIKDCPDFGSPIGEGGWGVPNTTPLWQQPHYADPYNLYKVYCDDINDVTITTTPGSGSITVKGNTSWTTLSKDANVSYTLKDDSKDS